jgi:hypothetical protein
MEKPPYCVNSEEGLEKIKRIREAYRHLHLGEYDPFGRENETPVPRITGEPAEQLVATLRAHDNFRKRSLEISGGKVIG